jgi:pimeloyl-ACP methyl ester carboxylesterase
MPTLAREFQVIAVDQRGIGLSDQPDDGYDTGTMANDLVALMDALGHQRFAMVGHDTGMWIGYALAADHPERLDRLAVAETPIPGFSPSPPLLSNARLNAQLFHFGFNWLDELNEQLVMGREDRYFGFQFASKAAKQLPDYAVKYYVDTLAAAPEALHASFAMYRDLDMTIAQNGQRKTQPVSLPRAGDRRRAQPGSAGCRHHEARRGRCSGPRHSRLRALPRRGDAGGLAGGAERISCPVPRRTVPGGGSVMIHGSDLSEQPHSRPGLATEELSRSSKALAEEGTPTLLASANPALADYFPAWLNNLADDVTLEGSMMDGAVQGAEAVRTMVDRPMALAHE